MVHIFPIPASDFLNIMIDGIILDKNLYIEIYDNTGKLVLSKRLSQKLTSLYRESLSPGTYHYSIFSNGTIIKSGNIIFL